MPAESEALAEDQIDVIRQWIEQEAKWRILSVRMRPKSADTGPMFHHQSGTPNGFLTFNGLSIHLIISCYKSWIQRASGLHQGSISVD